MYEVLFYLLAFFVVFFTGMVFGIHKTYKKIVYNKTVESNGILYRLTRVHLEKEN